MADVTIETVDKNQARVDRIVEEKNKQKTKNAGDGLGPREYAINSGQQTQGGAPNEDGSMPEIEELVVTAEPLFKTERISETDDQRDLSSTIEAKSEKGRFNIDKLRYNFDQGARPNRYSVNLYCPNLNINLEGIRCINATLPGRQLESADWSPYGPTEKRPYQLSMDGQEVSFTFLCDSNFADRYIIDAWLGAIFSGGKKDENNDIKL